MHISFCKEAEMSQDTRILNNLTLLSYFACWSIQNLFFLEYPWQLNYFKTVLSFEIVIERKKKPLKLESKRQLYYKTCINSESFRNSELYNKAFPSCMVYPMNGI